MKLRAKPIFKIFGEIIFIFILLTFIISLVTLPQNFNIKFDFEQMKVISNVTLVQVKDNVVDYYKILLSGSFGYTSAGISKRSVWGYIDTGFKRSFVLLVGAILIAIVFGIIKGIFDSKKDRQKPSNIKLTSSLVLLSMPDIFVIIVIQAIVVWLYKNGIKTLPVAGYKTAKHVILPMISLSIIPTIYIARITALSIDEIYNYEYLRTALGKGASKIRIVFVHVLRNAIVEIAGSFSSVATMLISSLLVVEYMYFYPGLTYMMYQNYLKRETNVVIGIAIIIGIIYFVLDLAFKILKLLLNPKTREGTSQV